MIMENQKVGVVTYWITVSDDKIMMIWRDSKGAEHVFPPTYYEGNGTPVCPHSGEDMEYVRTEIKIL